METINDIVAEMRIGDLCAEDTSASRPEYINDFLASYADRIEAAWMREREAGAEAAQICGEIGEMIGREATTEKSSRVGNSNAVREVAQEMLNTSMQAVTAERINGWAMRLATACDAALATHPRNCDVGTAEEQSERYEKFCYAHRSREKGCGDCPLCDIPCCEFAWTQMPYGEGGAKC